MQLQFLISRWGQLPRIRQIRQILLRSKAATVDVAFVDVSGVAVLGVSVDRPCRWVVHVRRWDLTVVDIG